jgi:serine/threonine protein kinase
MDTIIGQVVDNYKIIEVIGRGGMGVVFKALDLNLEKTVALKMIDPFLSRDENFLKRFKTEAKALAKLDNHNIVNVYALRETELGLFMVMEYVQAKTISEWLREKGRFSIKETIEISKQILNAIGHAHKIGVIHRDIKPNNILLGENGEVKVMDFGLAKVVQEHGSQNTVTQAAAGTLYYMSPEQIKGLKNVDNRSDIYSIGMTIYEMLAGKTPFEKSESEFAIQKQIVDGKVPSPLKYNPVIPKDLVKFILKAIDKEPDKRFKDISEMQGVLSDIMHQETDDVTKVISKYGKTKITDNKNISNGKRNKKFLVATSIIILAALFFFSYMMFFQTDDEEEETIVNNNKKKKIINEFKFAKLNVESDPHGAEVILNDKILGRTPLLLDSLEIKNYSIVLRLNGYEEWSNNNFQLSAGNNSINEDLKIIPAAANSTLSLSMDVPGNVYINGKRYPVSANQILTKNVIAGKQKVKFVNEKNIGEELTIDLKEKQSKKYNCYFRQQINILSLNEAGDSFWGNIYVNGNNTGIPTPGNITLETGIHKVTVKKTGYTTVENEIPVNIKPSLKEKSLSLVFHLK